MHGPGKPISVCSEHIKPLNCSNGCLGVEIDELAELKSGTHSGCAICREPSSGKPLRILRKCNHPHCYGRFHVTSFEELHIADLLPKRRKPHAEEAVGAIADVLEQDIAAEAQVKQIEAIATAHFTTTDPATTPPYK